MPHLPKSAQVPPAGPPAGTCSAASKPVGKHRTPRPPTTFNTLVGDDDDDVGPDLWPDYDPYATAVKVAPPDFVGSKSHTAVTEEPPDFVGSKFQRTVGGDAIRGVFVPEWANRVTRTRAEMLVLAQIAYWFGQKETGKPRLPASAYRNGRWWVYKTINELGRETCLSHGQVRGAVRRLVGAGILVSDWDPAWGKPPYYRINPARVAHALIAAGKAADAGGHDPVGEGGEA